MQISICLEPLTINLPDDALDGNTLEEAVLKTAHETGCNIMAEILTTIDDHLFTVHEKQFKSTGRREKTISTRMGDIKISRRYYRQEDGGYRFLLDEFLGWGKHQRATGGYMKEALVQASQRSYRNSQEEMEKQTGAGRSHEGIRAWVKTAGAEKDEIQARKTRAVFEHGKSPPRPENIPPRLFVEVDGVNISTREGGKIGRSEMKLCILYPGKEPRYSGGKGDAMRLRDKYVLGGLLYSTEDLWDRLVVLGEEKYGLSRITEIYWGADGAPWCWSGSEDYPGAVLHLCKYHVNREITRVFGPDRDKNREISALLESGDRKDVEEFFNRCIAGTYGGVRKKRERLRNYLLNNWEGILGWRKIKDILGAEGSLGAIEGNIDKVLARRFKDRGCCWSREGAHALSQVRMAWLNGELDDVLKSLRRNGVEVPVLPPAERREKKTGVTGNHYSRFGSMPALKISIRKPWQKALRGITNGGCNLWQLK